MVHRYTYDAFGRRVRKSDVARPSHRSADHRYPRALQAPAQGLDRSGSRDLTDQGVYQIGDV
ncbi:MAG: hypothetical protein GY725_05825 [bacterium]|nr:hypothetical protein [bacterium]